MKSIIYVISKNYEIPLILPWEQEGDNSNPVPRSRNNSIILNTYLKKPLKIPSMDGPQTVFLSGDDSKRDLLSRK